MGKTELSLRLAEHFGCPILNADSRQIYRDLPIGTAAPTAEQLARVPHYFVGTKSLDEDYNAGQFERDCLAQIRVLTPQHQGVLAILSGGSMMYMDAVCEGMDDIPSVSASVRERVQETYRQQGLEWLQQQVQALDPVYWHQVDQANPQRLMHCVEVCEQTGKPFSSFRLRDQSGNSGQREFAILKVGLRREREELYERINRRVDEMMNDGLMQEAQRAWEQCGGRQRSATPNSLRTVGYHELFDYLDEKISLERAVEMIKQNSRHYAKRQMTWFRRDTTIHWLDANAAYETQLDTITSWLRAVQL